MKKNMKKNFFCGAAFSLLLSSAYGFEPVNSSSSSDDGNVAANTLDNKFSTRWSANGKGEWIQYDLGTQASIGNIEVAFYKGDERTSTIGILISSDGDSWTQVWSGAQRESSEELQTFDFSDEDGRYVRIVGYGNSKNDWNSITEVEIDADAISSPTPSVTPAPVTSTRSNATPCSANFCYRI